MVMAMQKVERGERLPISGLYAARHKAGRVALLASASLLASCASEPKSEPARMPTPFGCPVRELLAATRMPASAAPKSLLSSRPESLRTISISESMQGNDVFRYSAVVDSSAGQVWVYRYGGYIGDVAWFGPLDMAAEKTAMCRPAQRLVWIGETKRPAATSDQELP